MHSYFKQIKFDVVTSYVVDLYAVFRMAMITSGLIHLTHTIKMVNIYIHHHAAEICSVLSIHQILLYHATSVIQQTTSDMSLNSYTALLSSTLVKMT